MLTFSQKNQTNTRRPNSYFIVLPLWYHTFSYSILLYRIFSLRFTLRLVSSSSVCGSDEVRDSRWHLMYVRPHNGAFVQQRLRKRGLVRGCLGSTATISTRGNPRSHNQPSCRVKIGQARREGLFKLLRYSQRAILAKQTAGISRRAAHWIHGTRSGSVGDAFATMQLLCRSALAGLMTDARDRLRFCASLSSSRPWGRRFHE